jgi:hypothetical protein
MKAAQINAKTKPQPKAEPSTGTETNTDTDAERHIKEKWGDNITADTDQITGDGPTTKPKDVGHCSPSADKRFEYGRDTLNLKER